ncbi:MAG: sulfatase-like hydrolase/transferase [Bacteroidota bacterium]
MKRIFLLFLVIRYLTVPAIAQSTSQPNFVFILTDDHRYDMLGATGHPLVQTPHLDQLAKEGVLFTNAHITSAICTPSRVSIFLSQFERKHGVNFNSGTSMAQEAWEDSYPVRLRENGYYTGYIGKNHTPIGEGGYRSGVMEASFNYWYAGHGHLSFYPKDRHAIFQAAQNDTQVELLNEGMDDFFSNEQKLEGAIHFLQSRPKDQPFCLSIAFNLPHSASTSTMKLLESDSSLYRTRYRELEIPLPNHYIAKKDITSPKLPPEIHFAAERQTSYNFVDTEESTKERIIRSMQTVTGIDGFVGNLRATLDAQGLDENTIIVFTSDHGLFFGEFGLGGKALCYEIVTHVPMIMYNPLAPHAAKGSVSDELVQTIDIAPTLLAYAGIEIPKSYQGENLTPLLEGKDQQVRDYLYTENLWSNHFGNPRCESVQNKDWKYIRYYKNENLRASVKIETAKLFGIKQADMMYKQYDPDIARYRYYVEAPLQGEEAVYEELYHLEVDPEETDNLANEDSYRQKLEELRGVWKEKIAYARGEGLPKVLRYTSNQ